MKSEIKKKLIAALAVFVLLSLFLTLPACKPGGNDPEESESQSQAAVQSEETSSQKSVNSTSSPEMSKPVSSEEITETKSPESSSTSTEPEGTETTETPKETESETVPETTVPETTLPETTPPTTTPPVTEPPVTQSPVTQPPVTEPPVTQPPVTEPPVTEAETIIPDVSNNSVLIYYENFDSYGTSLNSDSTLSTLGWVKDTVKNGAYSDNTSSYYIISNGDGKHLYITNFESNASDSYVIVLNAGLMGKFHEENYSYQYDVTYTEAVNAKRYITLVSDYGGNIYNSFIFRNGGYGNNQGHYLNGAWINYDVKGENYAANTNEYSIVTKLLGLDYKANTQVFSGVNVSIRYVVDWQNGNSVYMRVNSEGYPTTGKWVLISKSSPSADGADKFKHDNFGGAIVLKTGGAQNGYIDNIIVWKGTDGVPANLADPLFTSKDKGCSLHRYVGEGTCASPKECKYCKHQPESYSHDFITVNSNDKYCKRCHYFIAAKGEKYQVTDRQELTNGADIRIMSYNILASEWSDGLTVASRQEAVIGAVRAYSPDVVGIQEVGKDWYKALIAQLGNDYVFVNTKVNGSTNDNYTSLAYNKNKVKLIHSEYITYTKRNSARIRLLNIGVFERLSDGKRFIVTNTHFNANHTTAEAENITRVAQATEMLAKIKNLIAKYDCPVFSTGDYNCPKGSDPYNVLFSEGIYKAARDDAAERGNHVRSTHGVGSKPSSDPSGSIDHIFYTGNVSTLYFTTLISQPDLNVSDHCPIFADFKLG